MIIATMNRGKKITWLALSVSFALTGIAMAAPVPINGQCWSINGTTISSFPVGSNQYDFLCSQWEVTNFTNGGNSTSRTLTWTCEWIYGGSSQACSALGNASFWNDMNTNGTGCGIAQNQSYVSNAPELIWLANSNNNNNFLWNLCQSNTAPISFTETSIGWTRTCPWVWNSVNNNFDAPETCAAYYYYDSQCGAAAGTGHFTQPVAQLCQPGNVAWMVRFNTETQKWEWECEGSWWWAISMCSAWATNTNNISPACNSFVITNNSVVGFPATDLCGIGDLHEWNVDSINETATWSCEFNWQVTPLCGNVTVAWFGNNAGTQCNGLTNGQTFKYLSEVEALWFCSNNQIPDSFDNDDDKREWTCWPQSCEAFKDTQWTHCWYAINVPSLTPPTQWLCASGQVVSSVIKFANDWKWICSDIQNGGFCSNTWCQVNYPNEAAICEWPRIVVGDCQWATQINHNGFHTPNEIIQSGLCKDGYPNPLVPYQDYTQNKWAWTCEWTPMLWSDEQCYAEAGIPDLTILYDKPRPYSFPTSLSTGDLIAGPVIASLTWYDPLYLSFTSPYNQDHRLFTQNGHFLFNYEDWAGNTWATMVFVDWIKDAGPYAYAVYSATEPTSWHVDVRLSGYDSSQNPTTFVGPCLSAGHCQIIVGAHPYDLTIRFTHNNEGTFTITDSQWNTKDIVVNVTNIDTVIPTATLYYSHTSTTSEDVTVKIISPSEPITVTNNGWHLSYTFTESGSFTFEIRDEAGNVNTLQATVDWIDKDAPSARVYYSTTWVTNENVVATLTDFTETGIIIKNNNGSNMYTFSHNGEFTFILEDQSGNKWSVRAYVDWINKPILKNLIEQYTDNLCAKIPKRLPVDIQGNEHNLEIITVIRNCLMKWYRGHNNHMYFYPRNYISRAEFIRVVGRFIKMTTDYDGSLLSEVSDEFVNVMAEWKFATDIQEADARWLLFYTPLLQDNIHKKIAYDDPIPQREAKYIIKKALDIVWMDARIANTLFNEEGKLTRGEAAYIFANLLMSFEDIAIGNNLELLKALEWRLQSIPNYQKQRAFMTKILLRVLKIPETTLRRVGLHPDWLKQDFVAIIQSKMPQRRKKEYLSIKTIIDDYLREFPDPHNNEVFNGTENYTYKMFDDF